MSLNLEPATPLRSDPLYIDASLAPAACHCGQPLAPGFMLHTFATDQAICDTCGLHLDTVMGESIAKWRKVAAKRTAI